MFLGSQPNERLLAQHPTWPVMQFNWCTFRFDDLGTSGSRLLQHSSVALLLSSPPSCFVSLLTTGREVKYRSTVPTSHNHLPRNPSDYSEQCLTQLVPPPIVSSYVYLGELHRRLNSNQPISLTACFLKPNSSPAFCATSSTRSLQSPGVAPSPD